MTDHLKPKFLTLYRTERSITRTCQKLGIAKHIAEEWLADPEFEDKFFGIRKALTYELEEELTNVAQTMLTASIDKERFMALQIAHKTILELLGKLNRERFGERSEVTIKSTGQLQPSITINLHQAKEVERVAGTVIESSPTTSSAIDTKLTASLPSTKPAT